MSVVNVFKRISKPVLAGAVTLSLVVAAGIANAATDGELLRPLTEALGIQPLAALPGCSGSGATELCITSVTQNSAPSTGGKRVIIKGKGFPGNSHTEDYVQSGLVAQYDGINNAGLGDAEHNASATSWVDLKGDFSLPLHSGARGQWDTSGYHIATNAEQADGDAITNPMIYQNGTTVVPSNWPKGTADRTIEIVMKLPSGGYTPKISTSGIQRTVFSYGNPKTAGYVFGVMYRGTGSSSCGSGNASEQFYNILGNSNNLITCVKDSSSLTTANSITSVTSTYGTNMSDTTKTNPYVNGIKIASIGRSGSLNTSVAETTSQVLIGNKLPDFTIMSVRLYNRVLSQTEITKNATVDQDRYKNPPVLKIGGTSCQSIAVISSTEMSCVVPAKTAGNYDIALSYGGKEVGLTGAFKYYDISVSSVSPVMGPNTGGNRITINGSNFPYIPTESYIQSGLVAQYDGINNIGLGDSNHSTDTAIWTDLKSGNSLPLHAARVGNWASAGFQIGTSGVSQVAGTNNFVTPVVGLTATSTNEVIPANWPTGTHDRTVEVIFKTPSDGYAPSVSDIRRQLFNYGTGTPAGANFGVWYRGSTSTDTCGSNTAANETFNTIMGASANYVTCIKNIPSLTAANKINSVTSSYSTSLDNINTRSYINGQYWPNKSSTSDSLNTGRGDGSVVIVGDKLPGFTIMSIRLYDRVLSESEVMQNSEMDSMRYLAPPTVKVGTANCNNVVVLSSTRLSCEIATGTYSGTQNVALTYDGSTKTLNSSYSFLPNTSFYTTITSPSSGPSFGGNLMKITGNKLNSITSVKVGGNACTSWTIVTANTYGTCIIPALSGQAGVTDIVIGYTDGSAKTTTLTGAYEYTSATDDPVKFKVQRDGTIGAAATYKLVGATGTGSDGLTVESSWNGVSKVILTYPDALTPQAHNGSGVANIPSSPGTAISAGTLMGWKTEFAGSGAAKTLTLTSATPLAAATIQQILRNITWTATTDTPGNIKVQLVNGLW